MLIQPVQPVNVTIKTGDIVHECHMISLSDTELTLTGHDYLEKDLRVLFTAHYFRGIGTVREIEFIKYYFTFKLEVEHIQFKPGLLIDTRL
ncbi:hypothetical protein [Legionella worsleiensis]|uniref:Uncharacterized protein n=1 Tax=Legionella worsleiensis TaxID=45076 RepID=A0A0W1AEK5_9GAMM|nr:hypothetical protein [Legionella worsleiensis]KTD79772.1 hypothetical protein Lwor_1286 [Legionella worsleiensis]STY32283.1 Uncharacterised protein [Legionella worsleiensis]